MEDNYFTDSEREYLFGLVKKDIKMRKKSLKYYSKDGMTFRGKPANDKQRYQWDDDVYKHSEDLETLRMLDLHISLTPTDVKLLLELLKRFVKSKTKIIQGFSSDGTLSKGIPVTEGQRSVYEITIKDLTTAQNMQERLYNYRRIYNLLNQ